MKFKKICGAQKFDVYTFDIDHIFLTFIFGDIYWWQTLRSFMSLGWICCNKSLKLFLSIDAIAKAQHKNDFPWSWIILEFNVASLFWFSYFFDVILVLISTENHSDQFCSSLNSVMKSVILAKLTKSIKIIYNNFT